MKAQQETSSITGDNGRHEQQQQEEESDYYPGDNKGLELLTVSQALQLDRPQPVLKRWSCHNDLEVFISIFSLIFCTKLVETVKK